MNGLIEGALDRSRTVLLALVFIILAGIITYRGIPKEAQPDVEIPYIYVSISHEGISPEDAERLLVRPMEQELRALEGVKEMTSSGYEGGANVTLEFDAGIDTAVALQDVRAKVDLAKAELPDETDEPTVNEVKISRLDPMLIINLSGKVPERTLATIARDLEETIEAIPGVLDVETSGKREELMEILVNPLAMESYGLTQQELFNLVARNNKLVAAGALQTGQGRFPVKVPGVFESVEDVLSLPVKVDGERVVHFRDIAEVRRTYKDAQSYARISGEPAIGLEVVQRTGANIILTVERIREVVAEESALWPTGIDVTYSRDSSRDIRNMLTDLQNNVLLAVLLVLIVIIGILGLRNALLVGIAIPGSFLTGILLLGIGGLTINIVVLFSLIMAVGMLVDGAIVVTELADRKMAEGLDRRAAYSEAARRMAWPIIASTATTLAAFAPLVFWPGVTGEFMKYLPLTLIATLSASLLMALVFVPTLGSIFGKTGALSAKAREQLAAAEIGDLNSLTGFTGSYVRFLRRALQRPMLTATMVAGLLVVVFIAYGRMGHGVEFFPNVEPEFARVDIAARGDLSIDEKDELVRKVERRVLDMPEFESVYARTGGGGRNSREDQIGSLQMQLIDWEFRRPAADILDEVRDRTSDIAGVVVETKTPRAGPPGSDKPIVLELSSRYPAALAAAIERIRAVMDGMDGLEDIEDSRPLPGIEWRIGVDRAQAARFGADVTLVGNTIQLVTNGIKIGEYRPDDADEEIDIRVRYPLGNRNLDEIDKLRVPSAAGPIPISNFVTRTPAQKVGTIDRTDMRRTMSISADVAPGILADVKVRELRASLMELEPDPRVAVTFRGDNEDQDEASAFLSKAMLVAVFVIAIILVTQFNSLYQALLILTAVLFSTGGVLLGHLIMNMPFGIVMSGIGVIALAGIVVNNNIVLIDTYNNLRAHGMEAFEAVIRTCAQRLRPVLLTTATTILGLMPMVLGINVNLVEREITIGGPSSQWWVQLSASVAGGLAFATVLTLLLTPSLLVAQAGAAGRWRARRERRLQNRRRRELASH
jgi:multidrug efflux pump